ncbi:heme o synthase [Actinopolymorpha singaporensis]|uniref:heme o synthase n=1 Tax=Actinopolymorpha singaporensis TaxID=117157 RepID=UPI001F51DF71|nr:heme o synthase [Actinopolymorpha singaporensis]
MRPDRPADLYSGDEVFVAAVDSGPIASGPTTSGSRTSGHRTAGPDAGHGRTAPPGRAHWRDVVAAYVALTKPRIIELLLVTTVPVMFLAQRGVPSLGLVLATMVGGIAAAGSANTLNCVLDRDIDERMRRTRRRPLPRHAVGPRNAAVFGIALGLVATLWLGFVVNWLSAGLALAANAFYILVYTLVLKRRTSQNIVWGGIAGCFPVVIGWTAVRGSLDWAPLALVLVVFFWTPPHTWTLAMRYREDYAEAGVPMLPVVATERAVAWQVVAYSAATVLASLALWPIAPTGWLYPVAAAVLGAVVMVEAFALVRRVARGQTGPALRPMRFFHWSNLYLALLFVAVALDPLVTR